MSAEFNSTNPENRIAAYLEEFDKDPDNRIKVALGFEGLALHAPEADQAETYLDRSMGIFRDVDLEHRQHGAPQQAQVFAAAHLNLEPIIRRLVVEHRLSDPTQIKDVFQPFMRSLAKQASQARPLLFHPPASLDEAGWHQHSGLAAAFNSMATLGLLLRFQAEMIQSDDWMAVPAFWEPSLDSLEANNLANGYWHVNIFNGANSQDFERAYKVYVRSSRLSVHEQLEDPETSLVWFSTDLALPSDYRTVSPLDVIRELSNQKGQRLKLDTRTKRLLARIDERTFGSLKA